ncbi:site-specific integrase [Vibrio fluvialis]
MISADKKYIKSYVQEQELLGRSKEVINLIEQRLKVISNYFKSTSFVELTPKHIKKLRNDFYFLPVNLSKIKEFKNIDVKNACRINQARSELGYKSISIETHRGYFSALSDMLKYLRSEELMINNPMSDIKFKRPSLIKANERNRSFDFNELEKIFNYINNNYTSNDGFKYWILYLLRYTGARSKELIQLESTDLIEKDGIKCLMLYPEEYKTENSGRLVPIHPKLINLGFIDFVENKTGILFPESRTEKRALTYKLSKWSSYWRRKLDFGKGKNLISFRHTFIDDLKKAEVDLEKRAQLAGHSKGSITADVYSKDYPMDVMLETILLIE